MYIKNSKYRKFVVLLLWILKGCEAYEDSNQHPCIRQCSADPRSRMTCGYKFNAAHTFVLSRYCRNCPNVTEDCFRRGCVPADGIPRPVAVINDRFPGPPIRVCEGDTIVVDVTNNLITEEISVHWHGIHQRGTPYMDGVPSLTQCGILHGNTFRYTFDVPLPGTYFWHSHSKLQRSNGVAGMLVVISPPERNPLRELYDFDLPEHEILVMDWYRLYELDNYLLESVYGDRQVPSNILVNGRGFPPRNTIQENGRPFVPPAEFRVRRGNRYRFRVVNNGIQACPIEISVQSHQLIAISADGDLIQPRKISSFYINSGERYDFILTANQPPGSYWMKFRGHLDCQANDVYQLAVLNYESIPVGSYPRQPIQSWNDAGPDVQGRQLNPFEFPSSEEESNSVILIPELLSVTEDDPEILGRREPDYRFPLLLQYLRHYDPPQCPNNKEECDGPAVQTTGNSNADFSFRINGITDVLPVPPPLIHPESYRKLRLCNLQSNRANNIDCQQQECICSHWLQVEIDSIVEIVFINDQSIPAAHPFHLHGHYFRVLSVEPLPTSSNAQRHLIGTFKCYFLKECGTSKVPISQGDRGKSSPKNAAKRDTLWLPAASKTVIRFRANNPGYWYLHCHLEIHNSQGMSLVFQVGDISEIPKVPPGFPRCANYTPPLRNNIAWN